MKLTGRAIGGYSDRREVNDFYATPEWATEALFRVEKFDGNILEPAAGDDDMVRVIEKYAPCISKELTRGDDFMLESGTYDNVVTNPPFKIAQEFVNKSKKVSRKKIAMFLKLSFLEGVSRQEMLKETNFPLARVHVFSKRVTLWGRGKERKGTSGTIAFAWFVWDRDHVGPAKINWI